MIRNENIASATGSPSYTSYTAAANTNSTILNVILQAAIPTTQSPELQDSPVCTQARRTADVSHGDFCSSQRSHDFQSKNCTMRYIKPIYYEFILRFSLLRHQNAKSQGRNSFLLLIAHLLLLFLLFSAEFTLNRFMAEFQIH